VVFAAEASAPAADLAAFFGASFGASFVPRAAPATPPRAVRPRAMAPPRERGERRSGVFLFSGARRGGFFAGMRRGGGADAIALTEIRPDE